MNGTMPNNNEVPDRHSPEFEPYFRRLMKLSEEEVYNLLTFTGIEFPNATKEEIIEGHDKEVLIGYLDEADSRSKVEQFLKERGV